MPPETHRHRVGAVEDAAIRRQRASRAKNARTLDQAAVDGFADGGIDEPFAAWHRDAGDAGMQYVADDAGSP